MNTALRVTISLLLVFGLVEGCKDAEIPRAKITVVDAAGKPQRNVRVVLFCPTEDCVVADTQYTNVAGESNHEIELPAVLQIDALLLDVQDSIIGVLPNLDTLSFGDTACGEGFITLREDEVAEETIVLEKCE